MMKKEFEDDGRTIADMSGVPERSGAPLRRFLRRNEDAAGAEENVLTEDRPRPAPEEMPAEDRRAYIFGAMGASLVIGLIFLAAAGLLILFLCLIWGLL